MALIHRFLPDLQGIRNGFGLVNKLPFRSGSNQNRGHDRNYLSVAHCYSLFVCVPVMDSRLLGGLKVVEANEEGLALEVGGDQRGLERFLWIEGRGLIVGAVMHEAIR